MINSKKGNVASFLMENFGLILGAIIVIALFFLASALYNTLISHTQGTKESFNDLFEVVEAMAAADKDSQVFLTFYMREDFILASFNKEYLPSGGGDVKYSPADRCGESGCKLERPAACGSDACLCLAGGREALDEDALLKTDTVRCEKINGIDRIIATQKSAEEFCSFGCDLDGCERNNENRGKYYLYFAGEQKIRWRFDRCVFGIRTLVVESRTENSEKNIYITISD